VSAQGNIRLLFISSCWLVAWLAYELLPAIFKVSVTCCSLPLRLIDCCFLISLCTCHFLLDTCVLCVRFCLE
jgi:hypothetical protein